MEETLLTIVSGAGGGGVAVAIVYAYYVVKIKSKLDNNQRENARLQKEVDSELWERAQEELSYRRKEAEQFRETLGRQREYIAALEAKIENFKDLCECGSLLK